MRLFSIQKNFALPVLVSSAMYFAACSEQNPIEIENDERDARSLDIQKSIEKLEKEAQTVQLSSSSSNSSSSGAVVVTESPDYLTQNMLVSISLKSLEQQDTSETKPGYRPSVRFTTEFSADGIKSYSDKSVYVPDNSSAIEWADGKFSWEGNSNVTIPVSKGIDHIKLCVELQDLAISSEDEDGEIYKNEDLCFSEDQIGKIEMGKIFKYEIKSDDGSLKLYFEWTLVPNKKS